LKDLSGSLGSREQRGSRGSGGGGDANGAVLDGSAEKRIAQLQVAVVKVAKSKLAALEGMFPETVHVTKVSVAQIWRLAWVLVLAMGRGGTHNMRVGVMVAGAMGW